MDERAEFFDSLDCNTAEEISEVITNKKTKC